MSVMVVLMLDTQKLDSRRKRCVGHKKIGILPYLIWAVKDFVHYRFIVVGVGVPSVACPTKKCLELLKLTWNQRLAIVYGKSSPRQR